MKSPFKKCIGIDPGKGGGIAVLTSKAMRVYSCPKTVRDMAMLISMCLSDVSAYRVKVIIEKVWAFPTDGRMGSFSFGNNYGQWQGILATHELDPVYVTPKEWQSHFEIKKGLPKNVRKKVLKELAIEKCPDTKGITLKTADALLIALYGNEAVLSYKNEQVGFSIKKVKKSRIWGTTELSVPKLYFKDDKGEYYKCHKLLPDIRRIFGEIEFLDGEPVEIIPNETKIRKPKIDVYYSRSINKDGTFSNETDESNQKYVASVIKRVWNCRVLEYPKTSPIEYYIEKDGRGCFGDNKTRLSRTLDYGILNVRKYLILMDASRLYNCPSFVFFYDETGIYYADVRKIEGYEPYLVGSKTVKSSCDKQEPAVKIFKKDMKKLI